MIMAEAKRRGVEIYFGVEAGVLSDHHSWTTSAVWVKTPVNRQRKPIRSQYYLGGLSPRFDEVHDGEGNRHSGGLRRVSNTEAV
jgi:hypothetical protein